MRKIAEFIVKARYFIMVLFVVLMVYCVWGYGQVSIEYDIETYLDEETDTRQAIDIMEDEFTTYASSTILVQNVTYGQAERLYEEISEYEGVKSFTFENTPDYYSQSCALFSITYDGDEDAEITEEAYNRVLERLDGYDIYISVTPLDTLAEELQSEIVVVLILAVIVIIIVLLFTSNSYAEVIVFLATFGVAALLNMGTNYWLGTISFISNSVCVILQLALAIDYAIILSHRFAEEKEACGGNAIEAMTAALAKAIVEISSSSLTTISGLLALATMSLKLGADLGFVLAKSILCSMFTVFLFMPGLMIIFSNLVDKTTHKNFVPKVPVIGRFAVKARYVLVAVFVGLFAVGAYCSFNIDFVYAMESIDTDKPTDTQIAIEKVEDVFGYQNQFVVITPGHDYDEQLEILNMIDGYDEITEALGIANQEMTMNGVSHYLTEQMNYSEFAEMLAVSDSVGEGIFAAYAYLCGEDMEDGLHEVALFAANPKAYTASLLEICDCAFDNDDFILAYLADDEDATDSYTDIRDTVQDAEDQLIGENYCRMVFEMDLPSESEETFAFLEVLIEEVKAEYPDIIFAGDSMSSYDLDQSFSTDNLKVSLLTAAFVFIILLFAFGSWGIPIPLVLTIEGAIFINFSYYFLTSTNIYFFVYLIVSAIQMGATIDYAIVITNRYNALRKTLDKKEAIVTAISDAFPTILTSGTIMTVAAFLIGAIVSNQLIATLGTCLGRGVIISVLLVMTVLPALLYIFEKPLSKTYFKKRPKKEKQQSTWELVKTHMRNVAAQTAAAQAAASKAAAAERAAQTAAAQAAGSTGAAEEATDGSREGTAEGGAPEAGTEDAVDGGRIPGEESE